ncbi:sigma-E processing peptidase SpoIIGA [Metabacillus sediminilitoris]|uniref:Sigma-E processing peptidase SpoIIGA n=1 Tax=Metabacillus sediminilitoris TaxID=2567941 RepID=A0A4S4C5H7_9BACI|nr:sigma-E processing peptidase SpoIIGA [Metabacillus sediminilitoris]QGQ46940.1 sigma-E processing peptidase SpoIIGA [Metabacillus sediminilitoris]THF83089.1 sigma-E processing peptidase SpoIIGA [Metabacillus sediminilitoris]
MSIYLDVIWLLNFSFDLFLLLLTAIALKRKIFKIRILLAALLGSSIVIMMFTPLAAIATHPIGKMMISMLMVWLAFGFKRFRYFFQSLLTFYFVTFMVGGGMIGAHFFLQAEMSYLDGVLMTNTTGFGHPISWLFVLIGFPLIWVFSRNRIEGLEAKKIKFDQIVSVTIRVESTELLLKGLVDSGNQLFDPITRSPVMIIDTLKVREKLPEQLVNQAIQDDVMKSISDSRYEGHAWEHRVRIIPYRVVGRENQFLLGFKPDEVLIETKTEKITVHKTIVGLNRTKLSSEDEYDCIVHPKMLQSQSIEHVS